MPAKISSEAIVLIGGGGHARSVAEVFREFSIHVLGYLDLKQDVRTHLKWLGSDIEEMCRGIDSDLMVKVFPALGNNPLRQRTWLEAISAGLVPSEPIVSKSAVVSEDVKIGVGSIVMPGAIVRTGTKIGVGSVVNSGAILDHDCQLADFVHVGPGTVTAGCVQIETLAFVGAGARILPKMIVGRGAIVGAGAVVTRHVANGETVIGVPAKPVQNLQG